MKIFLFAAFLLMFIGGCTNAREQLVSDLIESKNALAECFGNNPAEEEKCHSEKIKYNVDLEAVRAASGNTRDAGTAGD